MGSNNKFPILKAMEQKDMQLHKAIHRECD